jgi:hypothetical protein
MEKAAWSGRIISAQPRIRLTRSFDESSRSYLGYCLLIEGAIGEETGQFSIGIGEAAQHRHQFRAGDHVSGESVPVLYPEREPVAYYRTSKLRMLRREVDPGGNPPPWHGPPPDLEAYRMRGCRRLSARTYDSRCTTCIWGCRMAVEMIIDPWNPKIRYRSETFCYGPKSCPYYKAGPRRVVPGRKGMQWEEPDWVDEQATDHRAMDE